MAESTSPDPGLEGSGHDLLVDLPTYYDFVMSHMEFFQHKIADHVVEGVAPELTWPIRVIEFVGKIFGVISPELEAFLEDDPIKELNRLALQVETSRNRDRSRANQRDFRDSVARLRELVVPGMALASSRTTTGRSQVIGSGLYGVIFNRNRHSVRS